MSPSSQVGVGQVRGQAGQGLGLDRGLQTVPASVNLCVAGALRLPGGELSGLECQRRLLLARVLLL